MTSFAPWALHNLKGDSCYQPVSRSGVSTFSSSLFRLTTPPRSGQLFDAAGGRYCWCVDPNGCTSPGRGSTDRSNDLLTIWVRDDLVA
jgi:hypothetical protein